MSSETRIHIDPYGIVVVSGPVDIASAAPLREAIGAAARPGGPVVVDLADVTFIDCAGLSVLLKADRTVLRRPSVAVTRLLLLAGVDGQVTLEWDVGDRPEPQ
jgi:anti-anti-sigma factor